VPSEHFPAVEDKKLKERLLVLRKKCIFAARINKEYGL
jgi:hypothetical protein